MMKISASVLAAALAVGYSTVTAESTAAPSNRIVEYTSMSIPEQYAFEAVAVQCRSDVERHCDNSNAMKNKAAVSMERSLGLPPFFHHPLMQPQREHAPFVTFHRNTLEDFDSFLDHFMQAPPPPFLFMADQDAPDLILIVDIEMDTGMDDHVEEHPRQMLTNSNSPCPFDTMIHQVISNVHPEQFTQVSQKMNDKGNEIILQGAVESAHVHATTDDNNNNNSEQQQQHTVTMARRLQEVTPEALHIHRSSFLPFDAATSDCLEQSYQAKIVSKGCGTALMGLHSLRAHERGAAIQEAQQETEMFRDLAVMYIFIMLTMILVTVRGRKILKQQIRLGDRIFAAIYSKPALKRAVEAELGESVGFVPPIPFHRNLMRGALRKHFARAVRCLKCLRLLAISALAVLWVVAPEKVLPVACGIVVFCFWTVLFNSRGKPVNMCCCCCCGVNTENVKKGNLTEAQACCSCCSGTGVCSLQCTQCCDDDDDKAAVIGCCSCCGGKGCCCCSNGKTSATAIEIGCCSCGKDCPSCCSSSGNNIEAGCCCCCCGGDEGSCCCQTSSPKKSKVAQRTVLTVGHGDVYEGIPIQIV